MEELKDRIRYIRTTAREKKLSQAEFGKIIGADVSRAMIASYEGGAVMPTDFFLSQLAARFGVNLDWLRTGRGEPYAPTAEADQLADAYNMTQEQRELLRLIFQQPEPVQKAALALAQTIKAVYEQKAAAEKQEPAAEKQREETPEEKDAREAAQIQEALRLEREAGEKSSALQDTATAG